MTTDCDPTHLTAEVQSSERLPVTPFEFYYLSDAQPDYSPLFPARIWLRGALNRDVFNEAVRRAICRHPLLSARLDSRSAWPGWIAGQQPDVCWVDDPAHQPPVDVTIDLTHEAGLKVLAHTGSEQSTVLFVFHHACADGLAGLQFIGDVLLAYDQLCSGRVEAPAWRKLDPQRLARRGEYGLADYKPTLMDAVNTARFWLPLVLRRAAVVHSPAEIAPSNRSGEPLAFSVHWLDAAETKDLGRRARQSQATVNDLLLRDLFLTIGEWNAKSRQNRLPIRILVPTNLRTDEDVQMPAANILSFTFLTRRQKQLADPQALLAGIRQETALIKRHRLGLFFVGGLGLACRWPGLVRWFLNRPWPFATAVFSNVGPALYDVELPREAAGRMTSGGSVLEGVAGVPPLRRDTRLGIVVVSYAGRLGIFLRCDPIWFSPEMQQQLLDRFIARIQTTLEDRSATNAKN